MSDEGSPSLLNLRDFRFQKKSPFSYSSPEKSMDSTPENFQPSQCVRRVINPLNDSDSDNGEAKQRAQIYVPRTIPPMQNGVNYNTSRGGKPLAVLEKESQMRYIKEKFPSLETMGIHNILSKHKFNVDAAIAELEQKQTGKDVGFSSYEKWKLNRNLTSPPSTPQIKQITSGSEIVRKRLVSSMGEVSQQVKKKMKRMKTDEFSDSDGDSDANYHDNRVFDSDDDSDTQINTVVTKDKKRVLEFFQTATSKEMELMSSCSKKKAELIIELRPYTNWLDLVQKLQDNKGLSTDLLNSAQQVLSTRNNIMILMRKCKHLAGEMETAVALGAGVKEQPSLLNPAYRLTNHQMIGLNWLAVMHQQKVNGILADEMGLGKTIQVIAFLAHLKETEGARPGIPHLIIVPSSTLDNWKSEFERWCPSLKVFMYYGSTEERRMYRIEYWSKKKISEYDVVLTTYTMVTNTPEERKMFRVSQMHYVVFDEAHMLKNMNTQRYENLIRIKATNRILLTGTPLQNNLLELMSLLIFVMPAMFAGKSEDLKSLFQKNSKNKQENSEDLPAFEKDQIQQAKDIMKPFVLRRLKRDVLKDLPKKTEELVRVPMTSTQKERYDELVSYFQNIGKQNNVPCSGMTMMTDLRKLSNHPLLLRHHYQHSDLREIAKKLAKDPSYKDTVVEYIVDDLACMSDFELHTLCQQFEGLDKFTLPDNLILTSGKFLYFDTKLKKLKEEGHRVVIFSQYVITLNVMEDYLKLRNYRFLRLDGSTPVTIRKEIIDEFSENPNIFIFLLSTRAGGLGINLTAADTVIIHDIDFNPYNDKQAEDRCHRMGQRKPVQVIRLVSQGTIEEVMWQMNQEKLKLEKEITTDERDNPDPKSVVRLLSSALGIDNNKATSLVSPNKTNCK